MEPPYFPYSREKWKSVLGNGGVGEMGKVGGTES